MTKKFLKNALLATLNKDYCLLSTHNVCEEFKTLLREDYVGQARNVRPVESFLDYTLSRNKNKQTLDI